MLARLADLTARWRWVVVGLWVVVLVLGGLFGSRVFQNTSGAVGGGAGWPSVRTSERIEAVRGQGPKILAVADGRSVTDPRLAASVTAVAGRVRGIDGVAQVADHPSTKAPQLAATDGRATLVQVTLRPGLDAAAADRATDAVVAALRTIDAPRVLVSGDRIAQKQFATQSQDDLARGERVALPVLLVLLVLLFAGIVAALLPLAVAIVAIAGGLLLLWGVSEVTSVTEYAITIVTMMGLGLAVDYSLLILSRHREELAEGHAQPVALRRALSSAGRTVLFSGLTVAACLGALLVFAESILRSFAYGGVGVVLVAMAAALTLIPALITIAGRFIRPAGVPGPLRAHRRARRGLPPVVPTPPSTTHGGFYRVARVVQRGAWVIVPLVVGGLVVLSLPFLRSVELRNSETDALPRSSESRQLFEAVADRFPGGRAPAVVVLADANAADPRVAALAGRVKGMDGVKGVQVQPLDPTLTLIDVDPDGPSQGATARRLVGELRAMDTGPYTEVTGPAAFLVDYRHSLAERLPWALGVMGLATFVLLFLLTGSLVVPLKAIVMGALSLGATFGAMVWVFQEGHLSGLLGFDAGGYLETTLPVLIFVFAFGLSMDYEIFLLARIKEIHDATGDNDEAVAVGLERTGRIITVAALLITTVFVGFATSQLITLKAAGAGLAAAVVLDATVVRVVLVPATMKLLGRWNWWAPRPLRRLHDRFGLSETDLPPERPAEREPALTGGGRDR